MVEEALRNVNNQLLIAVDCASHTAPNGDPITSFGPFFQSYPVQAFVSDVLRNCLWIKFSQQFEQVWARNLLDEVKIDAKTYTQGDDS